ncbi:hypothetical protein H0A73_18575 [Alcaligenaceae bacterium]|nr:hypothetical protein [Alcaligenaceae bacterium]
MNTGNLVSGLGKTVATAVLAGLFTLGATVQAVANPIDPVSNPNRLNYSDILMDIPDYDEPFRRDGVMSRPQVFTQIAAGMPGAAVANLIGKPLTESAGPRGTEWDYNFKFIMPQSENYMVCQYKVVLDARQQVLEAVWRRRQCLNIVNAAASAS